MSDIPAELVAAVHVHHEGQLVKRGQPLPADWPVDVVADLHRTGGAVTPEQWATTAAAITEAGGTV